MNEIYKIVVYMMNDAKLYNFARKKKESPRICILYLFFYSKSYKR